MHLSKFVHISCLTSVVSIGFILLTLHLAKEQIFLERDTMSPIEWLILIGFIVLISFLIASIILFLNQIRKNENNISGDFGLLLFGLFCLITLFGVKVMADEIGREMLLGWETLGELIILHILLVIELFYSLLVLFKLTRNHRLH